MNENNFETVFFIKQKSLFDALKRTKLLIKSYIKDLDNWGYNWDFNLLHDLQDRLIDRIEVLQSEYYSLHWDKYQFNAY